MAAPSRQNVLADTAIEILAVRGARGLTHRAVERRAGLGPGAASNCFGTRRALVEGVLRRMLQREQDAIQALPEYVRGQPIAVDGILRLGAAAVVHALGAGRSLTLARRALFIEAASDADLATLLLEPSATWWAFVAGLLRAAGVPDTHHRARWLLAYVDGVIADQLARPDPDFDATAALAPAVHGVVTLPG